jgi:hypothetical protein
MIHDRGKLKPVLVAARRAGLTLKQAAARVGVHTATVCRWQAADPDFLRAMRDAEREYRAALLAAQPACRPAVRWRNECPLCRAKLVVRTANRRVAFWRCRRWPHCRWASWRPRYPRNCPTCQGTRFWSHSRKSVVCDHCRVRINAP